MVPAARSACITNEVPGVFVGTTYSTVKVVELAEVLVKNMREVAVTADVGTVAVPAANVTSPCVAALPL